MFAWREPRSLQMFRRFCCPVYNERASPQPQAQNSTEKQTFKSFQLPVLRRHHSASATCKKNHAEHGAKSGTFYLTGMNTSSPGPDESE
ncbi:hypothetical protein RRG08_016956 [Elysia crispata]|uniref:Uncharacterized protein n=1 Tax=Elysia crispata TaxID=231223 RepID=A0AAE1A5V3_9GAST|nr:hypothetical protein RRG08_016956 [Elysia crispata]